MNTENMTNKQWYKDLLEKNEWFVVYHYQEGSQIHVEYMLGYKDEPTKDDIATDSYSLIEEHEFTTDQLKKMKVHLMNKESWIELAKGLNL